MLKGQTKEFLDNATIEELEETRWLVNNPEYVERPVDIGTFINNPYYLGLKFTVNGNRAYGCRPKIKKRLEDIFDSEKGYEEFILCCGIGWGKDFACSVVLTYQIYRLACLREPQLYYGLSRGSSIHLMLMSINETHARDVLFGEVRARVDNSEWFRLKFSYDKNVKTEMRFPKSIYLIPGNSKDTSFVGYNIFTGIIDEGDDYTVTETRDDALEGYNAIKDRIVSRFQNRGMLGMIGSPKTVGGFMVSMYENAQGVKNRYKMLAPTWDSLEGTPALSGKTFRFRGMTIPIEYEQRFISDPERALRDLGARPALAKQPFITFPDKIKNIFSDDIPLLFETKSDIVKSFSAFKDGIKGDTSLEYYAHIDLAVNRKKGDRLGLSVGHVSGMKEFGDEERPIITIDIAMVVTSPPGGEIMFSDIKQLIFYLQEQGFTIRKLTSDSWNSMDIIQTFVSAGIDAEVLSVDRLTTTNSTAKICEPYAKFKDALYDGRIICHNYDILKKELEGLELINGEKVDHQPNSSKDCCLTGNTKISLLNGKEDEIKNLVGKEFEIYSCLEDGTIKIGKATNIHSKGVRNDIVEIALDNGEKIRCTSDHKIMMREGHYKEASELEDGDSLMPLYRKVSIANSKSNLNGYEMVKDNSSNKFIYTHQLVASEVLKFNYGNSINKREVIHHIDFNKRNNCSENLLRIGWDEHRKLHSKTGAIVLKKLWEEDREGCLKRASAIGKITGRINLIKYNKSKERIEKLKKNGLFSRNGSRVMNALWKSSTYRKKFKELHSGKNNYNYRHDITIEKIITIAKESISQKEILIKLGCTQKVLHRALKENNINSKEFGKLYYKKWRSKSFSNHKVLSVNSVKSEEVFDMTVEGYSNFALSSGVFVHNCDAVCGVVYNIFRSNSSKILTFTPNFGGKREFQ